MLVCDVHRNVAHQEKIRDQFVALVEGAKLGWDGDEVGCRDSPAAVGASPLILGGGGGVPGAGRKVIPDGEVMAKAVSGSLQKAWSSRRSYSDPELRGPWAGESRCHPDPFDRTSSWDE